MTQTPPPSPANHFHAAHIKLLLNSYYQLLNQPLLEAEPDQLPERIFIADFALLSHNTDSDPIFNYGNQRALDLFELSWSELLDMPSRLSAEPVNRLERERLLAEVTKNGYIKNYSGVRIAKSGKRFLIKQAVVWNVYDEQQLYYGQAAWFKDWEFLPS